LRHATHSQQEWQSQPSWASQHLGKTLDRGRIGRIDGLEYQDRLSIALLGESVARLYKLRLEGRPGKVSQKSTPEPCL
jgi:hypothetical protein